LINRLPTPILQNKSPFQKLFHCSPDYKFLRILVVHASPIYVLIINTNLIFFPKNVCSSVIAVITKVTNAIIFQLSGCISLVMLFSMNLNSLLNQLALSPSHLPSLLPGYLPPCICLSMLLLLLQHQISPLLLLRLPLSTLSSMSQPLCQILYILCHHMPALHPLGLTPWLLVHKTRLLSLESFMMVE
jgi:hypothetical protein